MKNESRYHRQKLIPNWKQNKLENSAIVIFGVGALGSFVSLNLCLAGVKNLHLVDFDVVSISNLNRQLFFTEDDVGKYKVEVAKYKLQALNPEVNIFTYPIKMEKLPNNFSDKINIIACCLDTFKGRRWVNSLAVEKKLPMVTAGMYAMLGDIQVIIPYKTPCFECQPLVSQEKLSQECSPRGTSSIIEQPPLPSVATTSSIIAGIQSQEIIKLILEIGTPISNFFSFDGLSMANLHVKLEINQNCFLCSNQYEKYTQIFRITENEPIQNLRYRIALMFGLAEPTLSHEGKLVRDKSTKKIKNGAILFVTDERLAKPIVLLIEIIE